VKQNEEGIEMDLMNTTFLHEGNSNDSFALDSEKDKELLFRYFTSVNNIGVQAALVICDR